MIDVVLLLLRVWLGAVMVAHGYHHARSIEGTARWFASKGFSRPRLVATASAAGELGIGVGLAVGLLTAFGAAGVVVVTSVAFWTIHRFAGFFVFKRPDEGWEYVATLAVVATALALLGPGRYSLDSTLGWAGWFDGWVGLAVLGVGMAVAALHLIIGWRHPPG